MASNICIVKVLAILALITTGEALNAGRDYSIVEYIQQVKETIEGNSQLNAFYDRLSPIIANMSYMDWFQFLRDYGSLTGLSIKLGELVVKEINEGSSDDLIWSKFEQMQIQAQSEAYYQRLVKYLGESNLQEYFIVVKDTLKGFAVKVRETLA